ncbi:tRNA1(Val) A37 N6-methylase TrmN6 [Methylobacterium sp. BE186]|uniref:tRNA1(Val) (adenine(37)-N6)-methyltransferase n=1 Tax=Methylobacterium sp. BE186 TaxID=2817715 RepID=UPI00286505CF|nr:methyltransferase [Methylobacterium sp. BE186]MDR7037904.1 tRNA1(Val) A37 N6-methylase TrmN6 [Methylobacterium sp. BE186]
MPAAEPDLFLGGRLRLRQPPRGAHRAGTDAVLLGMLFPAEEGRVVCDLGASTGLVGLSYALRAPRSRVILVEREPELADLARWNAAENGLESRVSICEADILAAAGPRRAAGLAADSVDIALTNPPFLEAGRHRPSPHCGRASAHSFEAGSLDAWLRTCSDVVRPGGRLGLIHRADALAACLQAIGQRFGGLAIRPVHARADRPAIRVLIAGTKGSRAPLRILHPLVLQDPQGRATPESEALHRGEGAAMEAEATPQ